MANKKFESVSYQSKTYNNIHASRKRSPFNDKRSEAVMNIMSDRMRSKQSITVQKLGVDNAESERFYYFLSNERVKVEEVIKMNCVVKPEAIIDDSILILGDSSSFNMSKSRIKNLKEVGVLNDGKTPGFHTHAHLALNTKGEILGLADALFWVRKKKRKSCTPQSNKTKTWDEKESFRWAMGANNASKITQLAAKRTFLFDREADNFELLDFIKGELEDEFIIRANHDRVVEWEGQQLSIDQCLNQNESLGSYEIGLPALNHYSWTAGKRIQRRARKAEIALKRVKVKLLPPKTNKTEESLSLYLVEARETGDNVPENESPVLWRLWTTHPVNTFEEAKQIIYYYTLRWTIEQFFRTLKKKGFQLESTELETFKAVLKQTTIAMNAACTVLQLVNARNRMDCQPTNDVFNKKEQQVLQKVNERMEGKTEKQKNPFSPDKLSWASWIIGRLGGWKGYASRKPPGPITMKRGLEIFSSYMEAYEIMHTG